MRLIDADRLKIHVVVSVLEGNQQHRDRASALLEAIDSLPTAYDVDKVVERFICESINCHIMTDRAVEIVKSGGIE